MSNHIFPDKNSEYVKNSKIDFDLGKNVPKKARLSMLFKDNSTICLDIILGKNMEGYVTAYDDEIVKYKQKIRTNKLKRILNGNSLLL